MEPSDEQIAAAEQIVDGTKSKGSNRIIAPELGDDGSIEGLDIEMPQDGDTAALEDRA